MAASARDTITLSFFTDAFTTLVEPTCQALLGVTRAGDVLTKNLGHPPVRALLAITT